MIEAAHSTAGDEDDEAFAPGPLADRVGLLKGAVYTMGVLLVLGTILLIGGIVWKASRLPAGNEVPAGGFEALDIPVAAGTAVGSVVIDGDRMAVTLEAEREEIVIIDLIRGRIVGRIRLAPTAPAAGGGAASP